jgi:hypothetical protein
LHVRLSATFLERWQAVHVPVFLLGVNVREEAFLGRDLATFVAEPNIFDLPWITLLFRSYFSLGLVATPSIQSFEE